MLYDMRDKNAIRKFARLILKIIAGVILFFILSYIIVRIDYFIRIDTDLIMPGSPDYKISYYEGYERYDGIDLEICHTLTKEEQERLLTTFDINVPENEKDINVYRFGRIAYYGTYKYEKSTTINKYKYFIEIDGVKDYFAFYDANPCPDDEPHLFGRSVNEMNDCNSQYKPMKRSTRYYLTYAESVWIEYGKPVTDKEKEIYEKFDPIFKEMQEKRYGEG